MPTKKRREKESERKLKDNAFGPIPDHLSDADMSQLYFVSGCFAVAKEFKNSKKVEAVKPLYTM